MIKIDIINKEYAKIKFDFNTSIIKKVKEIPATTWDPKEKIWIMPFCLVDRFINSLKGYTYEVEFFDKPILNYKVDYEFKTSPYPYQLESFEFAKEINKFILGDEMGLGKSKQAIDILLYKREQYGFKHALIVCGVKTLVHNWVSQIKTHSNEGSHILGSYVNKKGKVVYGGNKDKINDLKNIDNLPYFIITNVESLRNKELLEELKNLIECDDIGSVIVDEFHKCKNPQSQQGSAILKLKPFVRIPMTGTPIMNNPLDLYTALNWIGVENHEYYPFRNHYCEFNRFKQITGYKNLDELNTLLKYVMLRRKKKEVLPDLPDKIYKTEYLEMEKEQKAIYEEVRTKIINDIDKIVLNNNPLTSLIRLRQATGFTGILSENVRLSVKYDRCMDLVEEIVSNGEKVVIFSQWKEVINPLYNVLVNEGYNPAIITGDIDIQERKVQEEKFMNDSTCKVFLCTISAVGVGLTLTSANTVIFLDSPWNKPTKQQAEDRCHRIGMKGALTIITLVCKDTIDERVEDIIYSKSVVSEAIIDGDFKTNKKILNYLLDL